MSDQRNTESAGGAAPAGGSLPSSADGTQIPECDHWIGPERRHCKEAEGVRRFVPGFRCAAHTPRALRGLPEFPPGPGWPVYREEREAS